MMNQANLLAALAQLGQARQAAPAVSVDAQGNPLPMMQALQSYGPDVVVAGGQPGFTTGLNPRATNYQRELAAGLQPLPVAPAASAVPVMTQQQFGGGYNGPPRGRPVPPASMLRNR
jgi:hypothetical protein